MTRKALGRGLDALLPAAVDTPAADDKFSVRRVPIDSIRPNRLQPRKNFDPERLSELAASIKEHGLVEPVPVSFDSISNSYELIAGERRLRASKLAGLSEIDIVVRTPKSDKERLALALVENIQRDDLNAIETANAYRRLMTDFGFSQSELSQIVGKSKSAVSNTLRLLELPEDILRAVQFGELSEGHARALLMVRDALERNKLFRMALSQHLSVRRLEAIAQQIANGKRLRESIGPATDRPLPTKSANVKDLENRLAQALGTKVEIRTRKDEKSGRIILHFYTPGDFENLYDGLLKMLKT